MPSDEIKRMLFEAAQMLPKGYCVVPLELVQAARGVIDGPPGPHVGPEEYAAWDEVHTVQLAEQLALLPRV